ncbi:hypothetical protein ACLB2K_020686 [Fragaria x ananassa]
MADSTRMAVVDSSGEDSPSKRRKILTTPETMLHRRHNQLGDSRGFKLLRRSASSCSDVEHSPPSSCCSCNELHDVVFVTSPLLDLEFKSFETDYYTAPPSHKFSRETTPSSELCLENSEEMDSPAVTKSPPNDEIEDFFATAEKYEQKRFAEKIRPKVPLWCTPREAHFSSRNQLTAFTSDSVLGSGAGTTLIS